MLFPIDFELHTVRNLHFLSKNSTLISRENCRFFGVKNSRKCCGFGLFSCWQLSFHEKNCHKNLGEKLVKMLGFWQNRIFGQKFDFSNSVLKELRTQCVFRLVCWTDIPSKRWKKSIKDVCYVVGNYCKVPFDWTLNSFDNDAMLKLPQFCVMAIWTDRRTVVVQEKLWKHIELCWRVEMTSVSLVN